MGVENAKLKKLLFFAIAIFFPLFCLEMLSFFLLLFSVVNVSDTKLLKRSPAQLRMSTHELMEEFPSVSPLPRAGQFLGFSFDPVMGYRQLKALEWYGRYEDDLKNKFLIVTFGGSTTVQDNWPKYLRKYADIENIKEDIVVLNAGLWGYMTFNEKIYFTSWILPLLEEKGRKPDLVLSLDGINDIWYRILGYYEAQRMGAAVWYEQYHGYHQHHDSDMSRIRSTIGSLLQLAANLSTDLYVIVIRVMPYTMKVVESFVRKQTGNSDPIGPESKTVKDSEKTNRNPEVVRTLPPELETQIIRGYEYTLVDFLGSAKIRDIPFVAYLQPVSLEEYYPYRMPETHFYPGINYMGLSLKRTNSMFTRLYCDYAVETSGLYKKANVLYAKLNETYPGHFRSIIAAFKTIDKPAELFDKDSIHYNLLGKQTIAHIVIKDLIKKQILTVGEE